MSQDPGLEINDINKIDNRIKLRCIISNTLLPSGWGSGICWTRSSRDSWVIKSRDMKDNNNIGGPGPPSNHRFLG